MKNNAHSESKEKRLARLQDNPPIEAIDTLLNSIANFFNNEISVTPENYQTSLLFIGIHAVALTVSEALFGVTGKEGYKLFLEKFVDGETADRKFSDVASHLHDWRNILAHQWIGTLGHSMQYDYEMKQGWSMDDEIIKINPRIYCEQYLNAFGAGGKIWEYEAVLSPDEMEAAKIRIIKKYQNK